LKCRSAASYFSYASDNLAHQAVPNHIVTCQPGEVDVFYAFENVLTNT